LAAQLFEARQRGVEIVELEESPPLTPSGPYNKIIA